MVSNLVCMLCVAYLAIGCASMQRNYTPAREKVDYPELSTTKKAMVGDKMLVVGDYIKAEVLDVTTPGGGACYSIPSGMYRKVGYDSTNNYYNYIGEGVSVEKSALCDPISGIYTKKDESQEICVITVFGGTSCYGASYTNHTVDLFDGSSFVRSIIYSGSSGNVIKLMYTEQYRNISGMSHNVEYDISTSRVVRYKGSEIQVLGVTPDSITYNVTAKLPRTR